LEAFAAHATVALERAQLLEELRRTQLLEASIGLARDIQAGLLPENLPDLPGYEVAAWWQPAEGVGGDYYDVIPLSDGRLALTVADVSGHGVGPSLIMASARAMLHILTRTCTDPEKILTLLSESIAPDLRDGRFITFFLGVLDARRHQFAFANSGHAPTLYFRRRTGSILPLESTSFPLGVCPEIPVPSGPSINFEPGDILLLATDGTIEQHNAAGEMFGLERIKSILSRQYTASAELLVELLRKAVNDFYRGPHPADDVTLLVIKRLDGA
jgi:phosphoserine phosphatase